MANGYVAVIQFPGVNCEYETVRACESVGLAANMLRWNEPLDRVTDAAAIILPGGFSYQDRIRAGVVAAKDRIVDSLVQAADRGTPVMGICNGAQILVEAGIVPGFESNRIELALAPNRMPDRSGYFCTWVRVKRGPARCLFTEFMDPSSAVSKKTGDVATDGERFAYAEALQGDALTIPIPVAHAEGRFLTSSAQVADRIQNGDHVALHYASAGGEVAREFPDNPNGSMAAVAGMTNHAGNVLALMPHPERANWFHQIPRGVGGYWGRRRDGLVSGRLFDIGPGRGFFESLKFALHGE
ncbi:MAG: phosphoribosylformylglycinamidine synthase subunit PurQ [Candidatus Latescibacterota bacterium]